MQLLIKGRNVPISDRLHSYAEKRLGKLSKQLDDEVTRVELELSQEKNPRVSESHVAEATIWTKGPTLRAREVSEDAFASIDLVADKLMRQVRKYKEKRVKHDHGGPHRAAANGNGNGNGHGNVRLQPLTDPQEVPDMAELDAVRIVKTKQFQLGPMTPEEAIEQMDLVGHDFFVFVNKDNNQTCVLYKRTDGDFGLIEPTLAEADRAEAS